MSESVAAVPARGVSVVMFCSVIDNFGDIGICWRLSRQLVAEHGCQVRLFVDDLHSLEVLNSLLESFATVQGDHLLKLSRFPLKQRQRALRRPAWWPNSPTPPWPSCWTGSGSWPVCAELR